MSPNIPWLNTVPVIEGNTAELRCDVTGSPPPSISWFAMEDGQIRCIYVLHGIACADPEFFFWGGGDYLSLPGVSEGYFLFCCFIMGIQRNLNFAGGGV